MTDKQTEGSLKIIPLGGLGAVGKNITLFEYNNEIIIVDCGIMFPTDEQPGIDFIIPDFTYIKKHSEKVRGIIITHGHEDHIGAVPFLLQEISAPIYATKLTIGLIQSRLQERPPAKEPEFVEILPRDKVHVGSFFIEFIKVNHSIIDGVALAIQTEIGTIVHTGDFKIDFSPVDAMVTDLARFAEYGEQGVLLLMSDSTNAERPGYTPSESLLSQKLAEIFASSKGRIIVATFASNIHRIQQVMDVAQKYNRHVVISGLTMQKNIEIANSLGYLSFKKDLIIDVNKAGSLPGKKIVIIGTGSQGEPMSALYRMATGTHRHFQAQRGDTVIITASVIPGNERTVTMVVNSLMKLGADVYHEQSRDIHVSGHASAEELKLMITMTKPKFFMPVHGEYKHLKAHTDIAESLSIKPSRILIPENGDILELSKKNFRKIGRISLSQIYVDGNDIGDIESSTIRERQVMSTEGVFFVSAVISNGLLVSGPEVASRGFLGNKAEHLLEQIKKETEERLNRHLTQGHSCTEVKTGLKKSLKATLYKLTHRNPLVVVHIIEV
ncbi:MAG TPA: ribonuclease J [Spirochaetota bacterium]|nr:ribonuclease J [Spirochaetota bacterium]HPI87761.1 ribonuclease J [Spirochaetota bacterium]HPR50029.1 ribonuclease J [Spirochaetota bacterium]